MRNLSAVVETLAGALVDAGIDPALVRNRIGRTLRLAIGALMEAAPK